MAQIQKNMAEVEIDETENDWKLIPPGWSQFKVADSEVKTGKTSGVDYINWMYENDAGKKIWDVHSYNGDIGMIKLKQLAVACGHRNPDNMQDTEELHGLYFEGRVAIEPAKDGYDEKNKITAYRPVGSGGSVSGGSVTFTPVNAESKVPDAIIPQKADDGDDIPF